MMVWCVLLCGEMLVFRASHPMMGMHNIYV